MDIIPQEVLVLILSFIEPFTSAWARVQRVCRAWQQAAHEREIFRSRQVDIRDVVQLKREEDLERIQDVDIPYDTIPKRMTM